MKSLTINVLATSIISLDFDNRTINVSDTQLTAPNHSTTAAVTNRIGEFVTQYNGIYVGIVTGDTHGQTDAHLYLVQNNDTDSPYASSDIMDYKCAMKYSNLIGVDGHLPTRSESALLFANCRSYIPNVHTWIRSINNNNQWCQDFDSGKQYELPLLNNKRVVLVRRIPII